MLQSCCLQYQCSKNWTWKDTEPSLKSVFLPVTQARLPQTSPKSHSCCFQQLSLKCSELLPGFSWDCVCCSAWKVCLHNSAIAARLSEHSACCCQRARLLPSNVTGQPGQAGFWFALKRTLHISGWHKILSASRPRRISLSARGL